jgi:hypothetical protein
MPLKGEDILDRRAAEPVDGLVVVADDAEVAVPRREHGHKMVLQHIRILILVNQYIRKPALVVMQYIRVFAEKAHRQGENVVKVQRVGLKQARLVQLITFANDSGKKVVGRV